MASNKLTITDLEFDDIKSNLKTYLSAQSQFQDYDFTGSGMDVLLDVLAYNTHYMGYYANMAVNEMFIDSASLRESVVSHAKHLNVIPNSISAAAATLSMTFTPSGSPTSLTIAKNTKFTSIIIVYLLTMGNTFGKIFRLTTFGESHGKAIGGVIDGCPAGLELDFEDVQKQLDRRKPGQSKITTQRKESDKVEFLSGLFEGKTTGTPISLIIYNKDMRSRDYETIKNKFRPGHADYTYLMKYGIRDYRGGGRQSARETAARVAAGAIAKVALNKLLGRKFKVVGGVVQLGLIGCNKNNWNEKEIRKNPFFCPDKKSIKLWEKYLLAIRKAGSSCGAMIELRASGIPAGLGAPIYSKLDSDLTSALMSINAVKGVEIGDGFDVVSQRGTEHRDEMTPNGFLSNHAGGILGGISSGQDMIARIALKPTSSLHLPGQSIDVQGAAVEVVTKGRHDPCVGIRATPIAEAMMALTLMDHFVRQRGQHGTPNYDLPTIK